MSFIIHSVPRQKEQMILYDLQSAFAVDSLTSSHPLSRKEEEVNTPSEISEMFNTISYSKVSKSPALSWQLAA